MKRNLFFSRWLPAILLIMIVVSPGLLMADSILDEDLERRVEALERQIEELLAEVPEDLREEVRRRLLRVETSTETSEIASPEKPVLAESTKSEPVPPESSPPAPSAPAVETKVPVVETADSSSSVPSKPPKQWRRRRCNTLDLLDENADGRITALDRDWRYLYLWIDKNQDGRMEESELESTYALGVREIALHLETFVRKKKGGIGEIRNRDTILFDLRGNGFGETGRGGRRPDDGALAIDVGALARGGGPQLFSAEGEKIEGIQPFRKGWRAHTEGTVIELNCP